MGQQEFIWFFTIFHQEFRINNPIAFEALMVLAVATLFGFYNPKQLADFLEVPHQQFYTLLKDWSVYQVKKMLLRFMVKQAAETLKPVMSKSAATRSRAGATLSIPSRSRLARYCVNHRAHRIAVAFAVLSQARSLPYDQSRFTHLHVDPA
jgi:hypothetical protein